MSVNNLDINQNLISPDKNTFIFPGLQHQLKIKSKGEKNMAAAKIKYCFFFFISFISVWYLCQFYNSLIFFLT